MSAINTESDRSTHLPKMQVRLLTVDDVAEHLGVSPRKIWSMLATGVLPSPVRVGKRGTRFRSSEIENFIGALAPIRTRTATAQNPCEGAFYFPG